MKNKISFIEIVTAIVIMGLIISASVIISLNFRPLYSYDVKALELSEKTGYSEEIIIENYNRLIDYNMLWGEKTLEFVEIPMSREGRIHFEEVKEIFVAFQLMAIVFLLATPILSKACISRKRYGFLKLASIITLVIPTILGALVAWKWDIVFTKFHQICFDNDYWIFDPRKDPIINVLPNEFFFHSAVLILIGVVFGSAVCFLFYRTMKKKSA